MMRQPESESMRGVSLWGQKTRFFGEQKLMQVQVCVNL